MVKNEKMHYIDSDDQEESVGEKKITDNKWVTLLKYIILYFHLVNNINTVNDSIYWFEKIKNGKIGFFVFFMFI